MKQKTFLFAALTAAFLNVANYAAAQVTIGGGGQPAAGAVLDLNSTTKGGLLLSNVYLDKLTHIPANQLIGITAEQDVNADLAGTVVYNTNACLKLEVSQTNSIDMHGRGIYVWDGNKWNKIGAPEHSITFAPYNLGADPAYDTPKKQIEYLATCSVTDAIKVYGDLYQWGRVADGHEKRTSEKIPTNNNDSEENGAITDVDANGQPSSTSGAIGKFIKQYQTPQDWRSPQKDDLWGNGEGTVGQTDNQGGVLHTDGKYYQNTDWAIPANNPCTSMGAGWRVPTQDEWERLMNYDSNPSTAGGRVPVGTTNMPPTGQANTSANSAPLTWIPVAGGKASNSWSGSQNELGGYAVYRTADWTSAIGANGYFDDNGTPDYNRPLYAAAAPEPVLFFPAAGYRRAAGGSVNVTSKIGYYWSSTVNGIIDYSFACDVTYLKFSQDSRAGGNSVRCVKE